MRTLLTQAKATCASFAIAIALTLSTSDIGTAAPPKPRDIGYLSSADGTEQRAIFFAPQSQQAVPLVVALHTWSGDYKQQHHRAIAEWCIANGWAYIHPNFRGPNRRPEATGSDLVVKDIVSAVEYAKREANIDTESVFLVGTSGGGYTSLVMAGKHPELWAGVSAWVPISDLAAWHRQGQYVPDLEASCGGAPGDSKEVDEQYRKRSPLTYLENAKGVNLHINAGIRDGHTGSVPISHSLLAFNKVAEAADQIEVDDIRFFVEKAQVPPRLKASQSPSELADESYGKKRPLFRRSSGSATVTIFDGGHEIVPTAAVHWMASLREERRKDTASKNAAPTNRLRCGAAETVITRVKDRPEVYADLYARAMVIIENERPLAIVTADMGTFSYAYSEVLLKAIEEATGIPSDNILICPSQTHNTPGVDGRRLSAESEKWLAAEIAALVKNAADGAKPATLRVSRAHAQIGYNRRLLRDGRIVMAPNPDGAIVPWVDVLSAYDENDKRIGVLFSHAAHPVIVHASTKAVGPDFPGFAVNHIRRLLTTKGEPEGVFMFAQAACGNINGYPLRGGVAAADTAGFSLATSVVRALENEKELAPGAVRVRSMTLQLPLQDGPSVEACKKVLAKQPNNQRYQALLRAAEAGKPRYLRFPMRAVAIGDDFCIITFGCEMFAEYQLFADKASPFKNTFVFIHTNGIGPYVATKKAYDLGTASGYEAWGFMANRPPWMPVKPSAEKQVQEGMLKLLQELRRVPQD